MRQIDRGVRRKSAPELFLSHSSKDKEAARRLAADLTFCGIDAWLDEWEMEVGRSLVDVLADAMSKSRFIAILMTANYNTSVWTKTEYKKALSREQNEGRVVMLPLLLSGTTIPDFLDDKIYIDLREDYLSGLTRLVAFVREVPAFRVNRAIQDYPPTSIAEVWGALRDVGVEPYMVVETADFREMVSFGGTEIDEEQGLFDPERLLDDPKVSNHIKSLMREFLR